MNSLVSLNIFIITELYIIILLSATSEIKKLSNTIEKMKNNRFFEKKKFFYFYLYIFFLSGE